MSAHDKTGVGFGSGEYGTPPELFAALNARYQFDYDPFATNENALCETYSTKDGTRQKLFDWHRHPHRNDHDGLSTDWKNSRVFCNPPYSRGLIERCVQKMYEERERAEIVVALLPAATDTRWFQEFILNSCFIEWLPKRVRYIDPATGQPAGSPPQGSIVALFRGGALL
jgi:site-specific DNA-methyltransferase (adenine-specific)